MSKVHQTHLKKPLIIHQWHWHTMSVAQCHSSTVKRPSGASGTELIRDLRMMKPAALHPGRHGAAKHITSAAKRFFGSSSCRVVRQNAAWHPSRPGRSMGLKVMAIGFDFGDRDEREEPVRINRKKLSSLGTLSATLLVLAPVMKGAVAEAFLGCLAAAQKFQGSNRDVLAAYSKFYGLLLSVGYESWQDYLLDQVLLARDNTMARNVAQGTLDANAPLITALAHDLDVLQTLSISLTELTEYIREMAPFAGHEWEMAASSVSMKTTTRKLSDGQPPSVVALDIKATSKYIRRPPLADELTQWKDLISGKELWGQAAPAVYSYWSLHGFGITSRNTALRWVKGALEEAPDSGAPVTPNPIASPTTAALAGFRTPLSPQAPLAARLAANTEAHCKGRPGAQHVLLAGPSGTGKSWLLWDSTLAAGRDLGLRLVDLGAADTATIVEAARGCGRYPRIRFILVADHIDLPLRGAAAAELMAGLSTSGPAGWPSNTLLYLGASPSSTISADPVVGRFGLTMVTKELQEEEFGSVLRELAAAQYGEAAAGVEDIPADKLKEAAQWSKQMGGGLTYRAASQYLNRLMA